MLDTPFAEAIGAPVRAAGGEQVGMLEGIYADEQGRPSWLRIRDLDRAHVVPVEGAALGDDGLELPWSELEIRAAPAAPEGPLLDDTHRALIDHYGLAASLVRYAEEASVEKRVVEQGRVRVRKRVDARPVLVPVKLQVEHIDVTREPIGRVVAGTSWHDDSIELPLYAERASVQKTIVARERVRLETEVVSEQTTVHDTVRVEHIEAETGEGD